APATPQAPPLPACSGTGTNAQFSIHYKYITWVLTHPNHFSRSARSFPETAGRPPQITEMKKRCASAHLRLLASIPVRFPAPVPFPDQIAATAAVLGDAFHPLHVRIEQFAEQFQFALARMPVPPGHPGDGTVVLVEDVRAFRLSAAGFPIRHVPGLVLDFRQRADF